MAGNPTAVTAAIARTALPAVPRFPASGRVATEVGGNASSAGGQSLPSAPRPAPAIDLSQVVQQLDAFVENGRRSLRFTVDDATGRTIMTVVDANTQEVIRQVPPEAQLALVRNLDRVQGLIVDATA